MEKINAFETEKVVMKAKPDRQKEKETEQKIINRQPKASSHAELVRGDARLAAH